MERRADQLDSIVENSAVQINEEGPGCRYINLIDCTIPKELTDFFIGLSHSIILISVISAQRNSGRYSIRTQHMRLVTLVIPQVQTQNS